MCHCCLYISTLKHRSTSSQTHWSVLYKLLANGCRGGTTKKYTGAHWERKIAWGRETEWEWSPSSICSTLSSGWTVGTVTATVGQSCQIVSRSNCLCCNDGVFHIYDERKAMYMYKHIQYVSFTHSLQVIVTNVWNVTTHEGQFIFLKVREIQKRNYFIYYS